MRSSVRPSAHNSEPPPRETRHESGSRIRVANAGSRYSTEAWVLSRGSSRPEERTPGELRLEKFSFSELRDDEVLAEPLHGCWEANMSHAISRRPVDVCIDRNEDRVVIGNAGTVRVLRTGAAVKGMREGDVCMVYGSPVCDEFGYTIKSLAYDAEDTMGVLAKQVKMPACALIPVPEATRFSSRHWAAFSVRYVTAYGNWVVAHGCWRVQMSEERYPSPHIWGWGGGSALAELQLAQQYGWRASMIAGSDDRLALIGSLGIEPIDRRVFGSLDFDEKRYRSDDDFRAAYLAAEKRFLGRVDEVTDGRGVSIFIDHIGAPVTRATLRALARQGVLTTAGWKQGMRVSSMRALECIQRHIHVHTHYARRDEAAAAMQRGESTGWMPPLLASEKVYRWDEIPQLARDYAAGSIASYFPLFEVNPD